MSLKRDPQIDKPKRKLPKRPIALSKTQLEKMGIHSKMFDEPGQSEKKDKKFSTFAVVVLIILLAVIVFFVFGFAFILVPLYLVGFVVAIIWQSFANSERSWKNKFYISLYSWLFIL